MGVVYAAHDDRLDRAVAIKVIRPEALIDTRTRQRFQDEARAAARVSHPHICPLYELDEAEGQPFLVMELLDGEPLSARLARGPMGVAEALGVAVPMLDALAALHRHGIAHRDLKPANVFLTPHGVKLVDFGLAQPLSGDEQTRELALTGDGVLAGTPQYMAPEQLLKGHADERGDVFSAGAVIYEMLAGRPAFAGPTITHIIHAVGYEEPPPLEPALEMRLLETVIRQALTKAPADRLGRADQFATLLREAATASSTHVQNAVSRAIATAPATLRFIALPLRVLRPDPETDFLAFSVPDAISVSLAALPSVVVRSPSAGAAATAHRDVRAVARELAVDVVLSGTLLRAGAHVRVSAQLADATGTLLWSDVAQAPIADLFQLQDTLTTHIVSSLRLPLTTRDRRALDRGAPASAEAYELFLRANELMTDTARWPEARELYERAVALDDSYAPAWARLGRARRVLAKFGGPAGAGLLPRAQEAFRRAQELNPDLSIVDDLAAYGEAEFGRAPQAMERLLRRAAARPSDPGLMAGLVTTCRYAGLLDASAAAKARLDTVDPATRTSVAWTYYLKGRFAEAIAADQSSPPFCALASRAMLGDPSVAETIREYESAARSPGTRLALASHRTAILGDVDGARLAIAELRAAGFADPEAWYLYAAPLAQRGATGPALDLLRDAIDGGYACAEPLRQWPLWTSLAGTAAFDTLTRRAAGMVETAAALFEAADGPRLLAIR